MYKQLGASFSVRGYLLILLMAAGLVSAATNLWLAYHRDIVIELNVTAAPTKFI